MVKRIPFCVVYASGEDLDYPASELNTHGPTVQGWRSPRDDSLRSPPARPPSVPRPPPPTAQPTSSSSSSGGSPPLPGQQTSTAVPASAACVQEIVLRFQQPANICRIQVLAHQFMIPERIEIWIHYATNTPPDAADTTATIANSTSDTATVTPNAHSQPYEYMGFITLSTNESTGFKSRELQSVNVGPHRGTHLKLRLGAAHANRHNSFHQVALIAVNVLGTELSADGTDEVNEQLAASATDVVPLSVCDDLSFSMYVDESVAEVVREMESKKSAAVNDERFEYARKLKLCMTALRNAGERIGRYSLAKRQAVQLEDFITAKLRKEQIELYRRLVFEYLLVDTLLESDGPNAANDQVCVVYAQKPVLPAAPSLQDVASTMLSANSSSSCAPKSSSSAGGGMADASATATSSATMTPSSPMLGVGDRGSSSSGGGHAARSTSKRTSPTRSRGNSLHRRNKSAPRNSFEDYEERAVPALKHSHTNEFLRECQGAAILENDPCRGRSRLNERERRQAALPILVFGNEMVELFYSRQFQDREEGLMQLGIILSGSAETADSDPTIRQRLLAVGINKIARSSTLLLHRTVRDAVFSVFSLATETVRALFVDFVPGRVSASEVARCVDRLLPELLSKCGDPSPRIHTLAQHTILSIAACPEVREQHLVAPALSRTVGSGTHPRLALSRMQMLEQLALNQGISADKQSGMTCRTLSECGCSGIHHPSEPVRKVAERILVLVYNVNPRLVRKQLPPDDDITRRNLLYRQLFTEFDKLDVQRRKDLVQLEKTRLAAATAATSASAAAGAAVDALAAPQSHPQSSQRATSPTAMLSMLSSTRDLKTMTIDRNRHQRTKFGFNASDRSMYATTAYAARPTRTPNTELSANSRMPVAQRGNGRVTSVSKTSPPASASDSESAPAAAGSRSNATTTSAAAKKALALPGQCPFCKWSYSGDARDLDKHFWRVCPMLHKCPQCSQVQEVSALHEHLLNECDGKADYVRCDRCTEVVHKDVYDIHALEPYCNPPAGNGDSSACGRCPLCHEDVASTATGGWRRHLGEPGMCQGNTRHLAQ